MAKFTQPRIIPNCNSSFNIFKLHFFVLNCALIISVINDVLEYCEKEIGAE